jgi:hypothetical protein
VQGLAAELERLGQFALIDPSLHQLDHQQLPLALLAEIDLLDQRTSMVEIAFAPRTARATKLIGPADGKPSLRRVVRFPLREHRGLNHRRRLG